MSREATSTPRPVVETHPLTPERWGDFAAIMNARFDTRHCWCMWPRLATRYADRTAAANRRSIKEVVDTAAAPPGVLAYVDGEPAGWCAVAPRGEYPKLDRSCATAAVDREPVWSVVCFTVLRRMRGQGLSKLLLSAAVDLAAQHGAKIIEGYPVEGTRNQFRGIASVFKDAGFEEAVRRQPNRPLMRLRVTSARKRRRAAS